MLPLWADMSKQAIDKCIRPGCKGEPESRLITDTNKWYVRCPACRIKTLDEYLSSVKAWRAWYGNASGLPE